MKTSNERGSALPIVLIMLAVLTTYGIISTNLAKTEIICANADAQYKKAFYNAEAGANIALTDLKRLVKLNEGVGPGWSNMVDPIVFTNTNYSITNVSFSVSMRPKRNPGGNIVLWGNIDNNAVCEENTTVGYPIMIVTSTGTTIGSTAVVEIIARMDIIFSNIHAALYGAEGVDRNGNAARVDGQYYLGPSNCQDIDSSNNYDVVTLVGTSSDLSANKFCSETICGNPVKTSDDGPQYSITKIIDNLKSKATIIPNDLSGSSPLGSAEEPGIFYCPGDLQISGSLIIYGAILAEGNITITGTPEIKGVALVKGTSTIKGNVMTYGAWLGLGVITLSGNTSIMYDCRELQKLTTTYEKYSMVCWMEK